MTTTTNAPHRNGDMKFTKGDCFYRLVPRGSTNPGDQRVELWRAKLVRCGKKAWGWELDRGSDGLLSGHQVKPGTLPALEPEHLVWGPWSSALQIAMLELVRACTRFAAGTLLPSCLSYYNMTDRAEMAEMWIVGGLAFLMQTIRDGDPFGMCGVKPQGSAIAHCVFTGKSTGVLVMPVRKYDLAGLVTGSKPLCSKTIKRAKAAKAAWKRYEGGSVTWAHAAWL
jgi:hypothetical protein